MSPQAGVSPHPDAIRAVLALVQPGLAAEKGASLFEAMDSISDATMECYEALFDPDTNEWSDSVQELYSGDSSARQDDNRIDPMVVRMFLVQMF